MEDECNRKTERRVYGLVSRRERWGLTWKGWVAVLLSCAGLGLVGVRSIYPFLAVQAPVAAEDLVVEGWVRDYAIESCIKEYEKGNYRRIFSTGGPVTGLGGYVNDFQTSASVGAERLKKHGLPADQVVMVPTRVLDRDRTYSSAVALREWFRTNEVKVTAINVLTEDVHARRSRLMYQNVFGKDVRVGIIAVANPDYDAEHWWRYSEGVKDAISEGAAYLYARFLFTP